MAVCTQLKAAQFYQHCATLYTTLYGSTNIFYPFFQKSYFPKFLGPFPRPQGLLPLIFESPNSPYISPNFFPTFDHTSHFLLHGTAKRLTSTSYVLLALHQGVPNLLARALHGPNSSFPPLEAVDPNLHRHTYSQLLDGGLHRTPRCSVLPTLRNTIYQSIQWQLVPNFPILFFQTSNIQKFFGPFPGAPRAFAPHFRIPLLPLHIPTFSQISASILTTFFTVLPNGLTTRSYVLLALHSGMPDLWTASYMARIHPSMLWSLTSTVTPTPLIYSFFSCSPQSKIDRTFVIRTF